MKKIYNKSWNFYKNKLINYKFKKPLIKMKNKRVKQLKKLWTKIIIKINKKFFKFATILLINFFKKIRIQLSKKNKIRSKLIELKYL